MKWVDINEYKYVCIKFVHACWENWQYALKICIDNAEYQNFDIFSNQSIREIFSKSNRNYFFHHQRYLWTNLQFRIDETTSWQAKISRENASPWKWNKNISSHCETWKKSVSGLWWLLATSKAEHKWHVSILNLSNDM